MIYLTAIWLTRSGSSTINIYTQTVSRTTQTIRKQIIRNSADRAPSLRRHLPYNWGKNTEKPPSR